MNGPEMPLRRTPGRTPGFYFRLSPARNDISGVMSREVTIPFRQNSRPNVVSDWVEPGGRQDNRENPLEAS
jgi:hypothetical protein